MNTAVQDRTRGLASIALLLSLCAAPTSPLTAIDADVLGSSRLLKMSEAHPRSSALVICVFFAVASSVTMAAATPMLETTTEEDKCQWSQKHENETRDKTDESCYLFISKGMSFHEANESCVDEGAHLVSIGNKSENAHVVKLKQMAEIWIGLYRQTNESCAGRSCTTWMWLDGSVPGYSSWRDGRTGNTVQCVFMNTAGTWEHTQLCTSNLSFVCEKSIPPSTTTPVNPGVTDKENTIDRTDGCKWDRTNGARAQNDKSCYLLVSEGKTFYEANKSCVDEGAHLVSIGNMSENAHVVKLKQMAEIWIGLYRQTNESCAGRSCTTWMWLDGSVPGYSSWRDGRIDSTTQCVFMNTTGTWEHTQLCTSNLSFVCEKSIPPSTTTPELTSLAVTSEMTGTSLSNSETDRFSIFIGVGLFVGIFAIGFIVGAVVCVMKRRHGRQMGSSQVTTGRDVLTDMGDYENVDMSVSSQGPVISQTAKPEGAYVNPITTDSTLSTRNHEYDTTNRPAYEEVSNYTAVSPEYTPLQFTGPH